MSEGINSGRWAGSAVVLLFALVAATTASGEPVVESLDLLVEFEKFDGAWLVTSAATEG